ncbi:MAG TPA: hypothetical protein G4N92_06650 [Anaerolineae bacterium]|nr:hypothetical protein [Anaerolineae bacterium]
MLGQYDAGLKEIPIEKVIGSVNRYYDFDDAFLPRQTHTRGRWENIDKAFLCDVTLPPVKVYEIGSFYFVKDGNHHVAVAKEKGQKFIDTNMIIIEVPYKIDEDFNINSLILKKELAKFYEQTNLANLHPSVHIK